MADTSVAVATKNTLPKMKSDSDVVASCSNTGSLPRPSKLGFTDDVNHNIVSTDVASATEKVILPQRYTLPPGHTRNGDVSPDEREADLDAAIRWLRQEILQMKSQDRILMRQFMVLNTTISEIKDTQLTSNSFDLGYSSHSLDHWAENSLALSEEWSPMSERDVLVDFQGREDSTECSPVVENDVVAEFRGHGHSQQVPRVPLWIQSGNKEEFV